MGTYRAKIRNPGCPSRSVAKPKDTNDGTFTQNQREREG